MRLDPLMTASPQTGAIRYLTDDLLAEVYLAPKAQFDLAEVLADRPAPWSESFDADPEATARAVEAGLVAVARATLHLNPAEIETSALPSGRARTHLEALKALWSDIGGLPEPLATWAHTLRSDASEALEALPLLDPAPCAFTDPCERTLSDTLLAHHGVSDPEKLAAWLVRQPSRDGVARGAFGHLQRELGRSSAPIPIDDSIACFGLRAPRDEAEFAAARCQYFLDTAVVSTPQDIGLLVPDDPGYEAALRDAFDRVGVPLSGVAKEPARRDLVGELLSLLLVLLERPAPRTALASLYVSPLLPWPREIGRRMARDVIDRGWSRTASELDRPGRAILDSLHPAHTPEQLFAKLGTVAKALPEVNLRQRIAPLRAVTSETLDWPTLHKLAAPSPEPESAPNRFVEGVSLFPEGALPWRPVRHLMVLGLTGRRWPRAPGNNPFFTESEISAINASTGLSLPGRRHQIARGLELFRRQLCSATESATLLAPACDLRGEHLPVSTGFALISHLLGAEPEKLLRDLRAEAPETWPVTPHVPDTAPRGGTPALPEDGLVDLNTDLLSLRKSDDGCPAPQSPSRLETLLVSPLAWLLEELGARERTWAPETLDVMTLGSILHRVLELVFPEGVQKLDRSAVSSAVPQALDAAIARYASWLSAPAWETERASLLREAQEVATAWAEFLTKTGAEILHNEIDLSGDHDGLLLGGKADCLLRLPDGRVLVVDHKRSRAAGRRDRMAKGWDLQVALYRAMLENPTKRTPLTELIDNGTRVVTAYHTMLDATVLSDADGAGVPLLETAAEDASSEALAALADLVTQVRTGTIRLNREDDAKRLDKEAGIKAYALKDNAFVAAFTLPAEEGLE